MEGTEGEYSVEDGASSVIKRKNRTLLTDKSTRPDREQRAGGVQGQQLAKIPEGMFKKKSTKKEEAQSTDKLGSLPKSMKMSDAERAFLQEYRALEELEREKGIKFFECIGDPPATVDFVNGVKVMR